MSCLKPQTLRTVASINVSFLIPTGNWEFSDRGFWGFRAVGFTEQLNPDLKRNTGCVVLLAGSQEARRCIVYNEPEHSTEKP